MKNLAVAGAASAMGLGPIDSVGLYLFGVPGNVIFMAMVGASISHTLPLDGQPKLGKKALYVSILVNTLIATASVSVLPGMLGWDWYSTKVEGSMALIFALSARIAVPLFYKTLPEVMRKWLKVGEYNPNKKAEVDENI